MNTQQAQADPDLLPTEKDIAFYREHGFFISDQILPDELLDEALNGMERFYSGDHDSPAPGGRQPSSLQWRPEHGNVLRKNDYASLQVRQLAALVRYPAITAVAARLSGSPVIRLWHDQLLYKPIDDPAAPANVGWHTDRQYWQTCTSDDMLTAWVPFHDCDEHAGTITFIDGSHRWPTNRLDFFAHDLDSLERQFQTGGNAVIRVPANLKRGQVSFHHCKTIHGSGPNRGSSPRRSIAIHLQPAANRYRLLRGDDGRVVHHSNDDLCRHGADGMPDYADPDICPVLCRDRTV